MVACMTAPRNVRPGITWFVTHRSTRRHFLFSPDEAGVVEQIYWYTTAVFAKQYGIEVHMAQLLSTHPHEVLTDTTGRLCLFFERRNHAFANALKVLRGWPGEVFDKRQANWVELPTAATVVKESAYTAANCVAAGLVRTPQRWPGVKVLVDDMGRRVIKVKRPDLYFRADNPQWPDEVELPIVMPALLERAYGSHESCREVVQAELDKLVRKAHADNSRKGLGYLGAKRVLKTPHTKRASSFELFGSRVPSFSAAGDSTVARAMLEQRREFHRAYHQAWQAWARGDRCVMFPYGTWKMHVAHGARCHPPP